MTPPAIPLATGSAIHLGDGTRWVLGKLIKSGGAGSVYLLGDRAESVAKIYHADQDHAHYERKLRAMLSLAPELPALVEGGQTLVQVAWPTHLVFDTAGRFRGFLMPKLDIAATIELEYMLQERQARAHGLSTGLGARITLAANLCAVVAELHQLQHYVVDIKPVNLRFYKHSLHLAVIDCDGFSVQGEQERHPAAQFTPDYLAPEFQHHGITPSGEAQQDRFALAVIVFQLLNFGLHPYSGRPLNERVPSDIPGRIAQRCYPYGRETHPHMGPSPVSGHAHMPLHLRHLFDRAFAGHESARPTSADWAAALKPYAQRSSGQLVLCSRHSEHQHFAGLQCAACLREGLRQNMLQQRVMPPEAAPAAAPVSAPAPQPSPMPPTKRQRRRQRAQASPAQPTLLPPGPTPPTPLPPGPLSPQARLGVRAVNVTVWMVWIGLGLMILLRLMGWGNGPTLDNQPLHSGEDAIPITQPEPNHAVITPQDAQRLLDDLLRMAVGGEVIALNDALARLERAARNIPARPPTDQYAAYSAARERYRETLLQRQGDDRFLNSNEALTALYDIHPPSVAGEFGMMGLLHAGVMALQPENARGPSLELQALRQKIHEAYRHAVIGRPSNRGYWYGLALSCIDLDDAGCSEGAFAVAHLPAPAGQPGESPLIDASEFELSRVRRTEFYFTQHRKERLNVLRARGQVAAQALGGPEISAEVRALAEKTLPSATAPEPTPEVRSKNPRRSRNDTAATQPG